MTIPRLAPSVLRRVHLLTWAPLLSGAALLAACGVTDNPSGFDPAVERVLAEAERTEIFALHPYPHEEAGMTGPNERDFHGYRVLGRKVVGDAAMRKEVIELVREGVGDSDGTVAACFNPRHGLRVHAGAEKVDLVICYECLSLHVHHAGQQASVTTTEAPGSAVSALFRAQGLALHGDQQRVVALPDASRAVPLPDPVVRILRESEQVEVLALHPFPDVGEGRPGPDDRTFHGYKILGSGELLNQGARAQVVGLVLEGISKAAAGSAESECFNPRHGLRARLGEEQVELLISYDCRTVRVFDARGDATDVPTTGDLEPTVSRIFRNGEAPVR